MLRMGVIIRLEPVPLMTLTTVVEGGLSGVIYTPAIRTHASHASSLGAFICNRWRSLLVCLLGSRKSLLSI